MASSPYFARVQRQSELKRGNKHASVLPTLSTQGNLLAGATARVGVGFLLNPFSVLKARFEVSLHLRHLQYRVTFPHPRSRFVNLYTEQHICL